MYVDQGFWFSADELQALLGFVGTDVDRYKSILLDAHKGRAVATDGRALFVIENTPENPTCGSLCVLAPSLKRAMVVFNGSKKAAACLKGNESGATIQVTDARGHQAGRSLQAIPVDDFPTYADVFDTNHHEPACARNEGAANHLGMNAEYLARVALLQRAAGRLCVEVKPGTGDLDPYWFEAAREAVDTHGLAFDGDQRHVGTHYTALVMPARL